jgi:hypothetical protein
MEIAEGIKRVPNPFGKLGQLLACGLVIIFLMTGCAKDRKHVIAISVPEQRMALYREGIPIRYYPVSTSKFGLGDQSGSNRTPIGAFEIEKKIGDGAPLGAVFKDRRMTGEVLPPDAPGRDPIVSRILWLKGMEAQNRNAFGRYIYIHGTPEERNVGRPVSYGCIRMRSSDVIDLYGIVGRGARVEIRDQPLRLPEADPGSAAAAAPDSSAGAGSAFY